MWIMPCRRGHVLRPSAKAASAPAYLCPSPPLAPRFFFTGRTCEDFTSFERGQRSLGWNGTGIHNMSYPGDRTSAVRPVCFICTVTVGQENERICYS